MKVQNQSIASTIAAAYSRFVHRFRHPVQHPLCRNIVPHPFPADLWLCIIEECMNHKATSLATLSSTCLFFYHISQAYLYKKVALLVCSYFEAYDGNLGRSLPLFGRSFHRRPELGAFMRELSLRLGERSLMMQGKPHSPYSLLSNLDLFPNLEVLRVKRIHIWARFCRSLHSHAHLRVVEFTSATFDHSLTTIFHEHFLGSAISEMKILDPIDDTVGDRYGACAALIPSGLRSLTFLTEHGPGSLYSHLISLRKTSMLEKLVVNEVTVALVPLLTCSPQLRDLEITSTYNRGIPSVFDLFPAYALPLLGHYMGPAQLAAILVENRPVHTVELFRGIEKWDSHAACVGILDSLQSSSVSLTKLAFCISPLGPWLWHVPITVSHLSFYVDETQESLMRFLPALSRLTALHTLFASDYFKDAPNLEEMIQISEACPSLREFDKWDEKWVMVKPNVWEIFHPCMAED